MAIEKVLKVLKAHRIISREVIKPSFTPATPCHPPTYNLSSLDQVAEKAYMPLILYYPNNDNCSLTAQHKARLLKTSLSQSLTPYYPFAGRLPEPAEPYIDCNDEGVVFLEARTDVKLDSFLRISEHDDKTLDQLFADDMVCYNSPRNLSLIGVQLNHFACGGIGLGVSMSHLIGDGCTLGSFLSHWASVARYGSIDHKQVLSLSPYLLHHQRTDSLLPEPQVVNQQSSNRVMKKFVFPNSKLSQLKKRVIELAADGSKSTITINNPTRVEVLTSLLYKTAVGAATTISGSFMPSYLFTMVDIRNKFVEKLPQTAMGNLASVMMVSTRNASETSLDKLVSEMKKEKLQLEGVQSVQQAAENLKLLRFKLMGNEDLEAVMKRSYACTSLCGFPYKKVDFGWGKPVATSVAVRSADRNGFVLMDTPDCDGIEADVILEKEEMEIFQNDKEMLSFCQIN